MLKPIYMSRSISSPLISAALPHSEESTPTHRWSLEHAPDVQSAVKKNAVWAFHSSGAVLEIAKRL